MKAMGDTRTPQDFSAAGNLTLPWRNLVRLARNQARFRLAQIAGRDPVYVYQMGKVGSSAIADLVDCLPGLFSVQFHRLMPDRCAEIRARFDAGERYVRDMRFEEWLFRRIAGGNGPVRIITAVREPIAHSYSAFFQNVLRATHGAVESAALESLPALRRHFLEWDELGGALTWLDSEISRLIGIDLLEQPFDKAKGWTRVDHGRFSVLILKAELDDARKCEAIGAYLERDPGALTRANRAADKAYAVAYSRFIEMVKLPPGQAKRFVQHRYTRKFYTESEINAALARYAAHDYR